MNVPGPIGTLDADSDLPIPLKQGEPAVWELKYLIKPFGNIDSGLLGLPFAWEACINSPPAKSLLLDALNRSEWAPREIPRGVRCVKHVLACDLQRICGESGLKPNAVDAEHPLSAKTP